ncbi:uncharacterized protein (DUF58 family) [Pseudarthrobacter sp. PvP004]|uniref:hypothetical protein n=1 Tax=Pseudarthrobacter sp. PvP004 TaxID=2817850 RepID=UPI001AE293FB|nr:hypothetical protein [Pseudarthrobacter sp. PvP004]MBP2269212.1 uncharacterized protein (DUF58 family) [Pseudarthrobacter sp. PvP004]
MSRQHNADLKFGRSPAILGLAAATGALLCAVGNIVHYLTAGGLGYVLAFLFAAVALILARVILRTYEALTRTN